MESEDQSIKTNSQREMVRILENSDRTNPRVSSIAQQIGCSIIEGRLRPGDDLNTVELSKQFHTSRTPVKEALLLLEKEGLVTIPPYRRPCVAQVSLEEVREIYQVRANLLMLTAELIVNTASDEAIASLRAFLLPMREMAAAHDADGVFWASVAFRTREAEICGNKQVRRILDSLGLRTLQLRHLSITLGYLGLRTLQLRHLSITLGYTHAEQRLSDRERLVSAYEQRDAPLAAALTRAMVLRSLAIIEQSELLRVKKDESQVA
jgi:DNA-binding GntR family transcriptional regulator